MMTLTIDEVKLFNSRDVLQLKLLNFKAVKITFDVFGDWIALNISQMNMFIN